MKKTAFLCALCIALTVAACVPSYAGGPGLSGAIFTTLPDGSEVNFNIYSDKTLVYLDGGPPLGAPAGAAGLPGPGSTVFGKVISGTYVFQVTDPSGKTLLSTDAPQCREFTVDSNGVITGVTGPCPHNPGTNMFTQVGATTVELFPFDDTPNNGGEYKAWVTPIEFFGCSLTATGSARNCGVGKFGFTPADSKTDNFKVKVSAVREIDTRFLDSNGNFIDGLGITWIDTNGASNNKDSYYDPDVDVQHEAHVEAPENGNHQIVVSNQAGCTVGTVYLNGSALSKGGPQSVTVKVLPSYKNITLRVDVQCQ
jgi:hypothetical protein